MRKPLMNYMLASFMELCLENSAVLTVLKVQETFMWNTLLGVPQY